MIGLILIAEYPSINPTILSIISSISNVPNVENNCSTSTHNIIEKPIKHVRDKVLILLLTHGSRLPIGINKKRLPKVLYINDVKLIVLLDIRVMYSVTVLNGIKLIDLFI